MPSISISIPDRLEGLVQLSEIELYVTKNRGSRKYAIDIRCHEAAFEKRITSQELEMLHLKIEDQLQKLARRLERQDAKELAQLERRKRESEKKDHDTYVAFRTSEAQERGKDAQDMVEILQNVLAHTLTVDDAVDWSALHRNDTFRCKPEDLSREPDTASSIRFAPDGRPLEFQTIPLPPKPDLAEIRGGYGLLTRLFRPGKIRRDYQGLLETSKAAIEKVQGQNRARRDAFNTALKQFESAKSRFEDERDSDNRALAAMRARYEASDPFAIAEYCELVLQNSNYPESFPKSWTLEYRQESGMVVVNYDLPTLAVVPTIESAKYVKSRDEIVDKPLPDITRRSIYDRLLYEICIRTLHELFEADVIDGIRSIAFNGVVTSPNAATGHVEAKIVMSVTATKDEFACFDLSQVDPKETFRHLKGMSASKLHELTPIPPIIELDRDDSRFVDAREIVAGLDHSSNLAAMDWEDFEHLIRELFEAVFAANGGEVQVTQGTADGGVDAIAFDPDPIRGGKIVIQAKRYTNTVGVAAVRDLYGTLMNEGATKGILVTTSNYGADSYEFAKGKPISLLNGNNLLALLQDHGHQAHIDIAEAKRLRDG